MTQKSRYELAIEAENEPAHKRCKKCGIKQPLTQFHRQSATKDGYTTRCKECVNKANRKYKDKTDQFWKRYHAKTVRNGQCLEWNGAYHGDTPCYGGSRQDVRRIVYQLSTGAVNDGVSVVTECRNKRCVRLSHLKCIPRQSGLLTGAAWYERHADALPRGKDHWHYRTPEKTPRGDNHGSRKHPERLARGDSHYARQHPERLARGSQSGQAKLTEEQVLEIREIYSRREITQRALAQQFNISQRTINSIVLRKTWMHI